MSSLALRTQPPSYFESETPEVAEGAKQRALRWRCGYPPLDVSAGEALVGTRSGFCRSRGVEGVLILLLTKSADLRETIEWRDFSAVAATASPIAPLNRFIG